MYMHMHMYIVSHFTVAYMYTECLLPDIQCITPYITSLLFLVHIPVPVSFLFSTLSSLLLPLFLLCLPMLPPFPSFPPSLCSTLSSFPPLFSYTADSKRAAECVRGPRPGSGLRLSQFQGAEFQGARVHPQSVDILPELVQYMVWDQVSLYTCTCTCTCLFLSSFFSFLLSSNAVYYMI